MGESSFLYDLERIIHERIGEPSAKSYTARLASQGVLKVAQKVGEEGVELSLAAVAQDSQRVVEETADLFYHVLVLLALRQLTLDKIAAELERRHHSG